MKEIFSAFGSEVFRPLMTIALPGLVAISSPTIILLRRYEHLRMLLETHKFESAAIVISCALIAGEILEDVGSRIEVWVFDKVADRKNPKHRQEWFDYLSKSFSVEPVGHRYMRTLVLRLKFELSMGLAFIAALCALPCTNPEHTLECAMLMGALAAYLLLEAFSTHSTLGELRHELLTRA